MRLQSYNADLPIPYRPNPEQDLNNKLLDMELTGNSSRCITCKYNFPTLEMKHPIYIDSDGDKLLQLKNKTIPMIAAPIPKPLHSGRINQLEKDLLAIRGQLCGLTQNKNFILNVITDLQWSYTNLLRQNEDQEREIKQLKSSTPKPPNFEEDMDLVDVKRSLDLCETKLNKLDETMVELLSSYQNSKENEVRYEHENKKLVKTNKELNQLLKQAADDLEKFQSDVLNVKMLYEELNKTCEYYLEQLKQKSDESNELASLISKLNCRCHSVDASDELKERYHKILAQQEMIESKLKVFEENNKQLFQSYSEESVRQTTEEAQIAQECVLHFDFGHGAQILKASTSLIENELFSHFSKVHHPEFCTTIDDDYELECVCEPCED